ncbi:MAG: hypothetical protein GWN86_03490, partial [Desulfobacterales bacterium]|nr:hypothetical protein [Desulfobacterales bacterium]
ASPEWREARAALKANVIHIWHTLETWVKAYIIAAVEEKDDEERIMYEYFGGDDL